MMVSGNKPHPDHKRFQSAFQYLTLKKKPTAKSHENSEKNIFYKIIYI